MSTRDRRANPRYPAWLPIAVRLDDDPTPRPAMLCDVSAGGALVWGFWREAIGTSATLSLAIGPGSVAVPAAVVGIEQQWETVILHLKFSDETNRAPGPLR